MATAASHARADRERARRPSARRLLLGLVLLAVLVAAIAIGNRLILAHAAYGVWTFNAHEPTPRIPFAGRTYLNSGPAQPSDLVGTTIIGTTDDGSEIHGLPGSATPTGLVLRAPSGTLVNYGLSGGP